MSVQKKQKAVPAELGCSLPKRDEPLHADLVPYVYNNKLGPWISHPLIVGPAMPGYFYLTNRNYLAKRKAEKEYLRNHAWTNYVFLYERPYRVNALMRCRDAGLRGREYWEQLRAWWKDSNNIYQNRANWRRLWGVPDEGREYVMEENERSYLAKLPEEITVYRGCRRKNDRGLSWTTDRNVAEWFANRFAFRNKRPGYVFTGTVKHNEILAAFTHDGIASEEEIVSDYRAEVFCADWKRRSLEPIQEKR